MDVPVEIFLSLIAFCFATAVIGIWKKIPFLMLIGGAIIAFTAVITDTLIVDYSSNLESTDLIITNGTEIITTYIYNVNFTQDVQLSATAIVGAEFASNSSSLIGNSFQCMQILLARTATLPDNPIYFGIMNNTGHLTFNFTSFQPSDITVSANQYESCLPDSNYYTIQAQDRIGAKSIILAGSRSYIMYQDTSNPFDGTNSYRQGFNPATMVWSGATNNDMTMKLYNNTINIVPVEQTTFTYETAPATFEFTEFPKILFGLIGSMIMIAGALIWKMDD